MNNFAKIVLVMIGVMTTYAALPIAIDEASLVESRYVAREFAAGRTRTPLHTEAAYLRLRTAADQRHDVLEATLAHAIYFNNPSTPAALDEIATLSDELASAAPLDALAWCTLMMASASKTPVAIDRVAALYERCLETGARERAYFEPRMLLILSAWHVLPERVRSLALDDARRLLRDHYKGWATERLAFGVATRAPELEALMRGVIQEVEPDLVNIFDYGLRRYRPRAGIAR